MYLFEREGASLILSLSLWLLSLPPPPPFENKIAIQEQREMQSEPQIRICKMTKKPLYVKGIFVIPDDVALFG